MTHLKIYALTIGVLTLFTSSQEIWAKKGVSRFSNQYHTDKHYHYNAGIVLTSDLSSDDYNTLIKHGTDYFQENQTKKKPVKSAPKYRNTTLKNQPSRFIQPEEVHRPKKYSRGPSFAQMALKVKKTKGTYTKRATRISYRRYSKKRIAIAIASVKTFQ